MTTHLQVFRQHKQEIIDLDWSLDDTLLLCVAVDGNISMWLIASAQLLRTFRTASTACCARFHMVNQNLMLAGTKSGVVQVFNCSTGALFHMYGITCSAHCVRHKFNVLWCH